MIVIVSTGEKYIYLNTILKYNLERLLLYLHLFCENLSFSTFQKQIYLYLYL